MASGGKRPGAGRPPGTKNKRTAAVKAAAAETAARLTREIAGAFDGDAHALLVSIYKDPAHDIELRLDAAKAAIKFEKPALAAIDVKSEAEVTVHNVVSDEPLSAEEWEAKTAERVKTH